VIRYRDTCECEQAFRVWGSTDATDLVIFSHEPRAQSQYYSKEQHH